MPNSADPVYQDFVNNDYNKRVISSAENAIGHGRGESIPYPGARPIIRAVVGDIVTIENAAGFPEMVNMETFAIAWRPGNPGNPAVIAANEVYTAAWEEILNNAEVPPFIASPGLSEELWDAPRADTPELRVQAWFLKHQSDIAYAEAKFGVDRRGIAGAIAWEALENVYPRPTRPTIRRGDPLVRWAGPGKVHFMSYGGGEERIAAKQVEDLGMLPSQTVQGRAKILTRPSIAIMYIAAIMKMLADVASTSGYNVFCDPGILATLYNGFELEKAKDHFATKKPPERPEPNPTMGRWVEDRVGLLAQTVGYPPQQICRRPGQARPL